MCLCVSLSVRFIMAVLLNLLALLHTCFAELNGCSSSGDCGADQCCMTPLSLQSVGFCWPRGSIGNNCYVRNDQVLGSHNATLYYGQCPCQTGQQCAGTGVMAMAHGEMGRCQASKRQAETTCTTTEQCSADECCVAHMTAFGRKRRGLTPGTCRKLKNFGESCFVSLSTIRDLNTLCPCLRSLTCRGINQIEQPFGEKGVCS